MKTMLAVIWSAFISSLAFAQVSEERSSSFVAGTVNHAESFGNADGPFYLIAAALMVVGIFTCVLLGTQAGLKSKTTLDTLEKQMGENDE